MPSKPRSSAIASWRYAFSSCEPVAIPLDLPVELGVPDRERGLIGEDAQERELLGRDPAVGEEADRSQLLAPEFERKSGRALDFHLVPGLQDARIDPEELELTPVVDQDGIAQAPLNRGGERGIEGNAVRQVLFGRYGPRSRHSGGPART